MENVAYVAIKWGHFLPVAEAGEANRAISWSLLELPSIECDHYEAVPNEELASTAAASSAPNGFDNRFKSAADYCKATQREKAAHYPKGIHHEAA